MGSESGAIPLHAFNDPGVRAAVDTADIVFSVDPANGSQTLQAGRALLEATILAGTPSGYRVVRISVEQDSGELEWAIAALVAIRGAERVDDAEFAAGVTELSRIMRAKWEAGEHVLTPAELEGDDS